MDGKTDSPSSSLLSSLPDSEASDETTPPLEFPDDFPLDIDVVYDQGDFDDYSPPPSPRADVDDPRRRTLDSLYPLDWLVEDEGPSSSSSSPASPPAAAQGQQQAAPPSGRSSSSSRVLPTIGKLRTRWQEAFQQNRAGEWDYVEYVPAWSDPDWDARYVYTGITTTTKDKDEGNGADEDDDDEDDDEDDDDDGDEMVRRKYAKPGLLQTQRPALRPEDAARRPTDAAKRWGVYPYQQWENTAGWVNGGGWSGVTPRAAGFSHQPAEVPLAYPRPAAAARGGAVQRSVSVDDLVRERQAYGEGCRGRGEEPSEEGFRVALQRMSVDAADVLRADLAGSLLVMLEAVERVEEREEYQRLIFGGNTSNDLVEKEVWTMGVDASTDLAEPLHDLVTRDKWARTEDRGVWEEDPRVVYDISGKQGEYSAHDETLWTALQPALQLVTKVLNSGHPLTWAWADIRKLRPVEGYRDLGPRFRQSGRLGGKERRRRLGIDRKWKFALWPDAETDAARLTGPAGQWAEFRSLCESGFDATPYACEILRRCVEWSIEPTYRMTGSDAYRTYGKTGCEPCGGPGAATAAMRDPRPFKITIAIAADLMWPLLVDEYAPAEKAAATAYVAVTMLHEISHALCIARCQMFSGVTTDGRPPPWLQLNPAWRKELLVFNAQKRVNILALLQTFAMRMRWDPDHMTDNIFWPEDELYYKDEPNNEEGWATENQYFGGVVETLPATITTMFREVKAFRFLSDLTVMAARTGWASDPGAPGRFLLAAPLPRDTYLRYFNQSWWDNDFRTYGMSALKFDSGSPLSPLSGTLRTLESFSWALVARRYGDDAREWLSRVWDRMKEESDNQILWRYLYYRTVVATEPQACETQWYNEQVSWDEGDLAIWKDWSRLMERLGEMNEAITENADQDADIVEDMADPPLDEFRRLFAAVRSMQAALSREATYHQNISARYLTLEEGDAKERLWTLYASKIRTRVRDLYIKIAQDLTILLESFDQVALRTPNIAAWLRTSSDIDRMWTTDAGDLRAKVQRDMQHLQAVCDVFSDDEGRRQIGVDQLGAIPGAAAQNQAQRLRRLAMRQYGRLRATDPRKRCADEWLEILRHDDLLRAPPRDTPAWHFNRRLSTRAATIDAAVDAQKRLVQEQHPDPAAARQLAGSALMNQQPQPPPDSSAPDRYLSVDQQERFGMASGYLPYQDGVTGFTRFARVPTQLSAVRATDAQRPATGAAAGDLSSVEQRIEATAATLQQMQQQNGVPFCGDQQRLQVAQGAQTAFGLSAAQCSQTVQQLEGLVGQQEIAWGSSPGPVSRDGAAQGRVKR